MVLTCTVTSYYRDIGRGKEGAGGRGPQLFQVFICAPPTPTFIMVRPTHFEFTLPMREVLVLEHLKG